MANVGLPWNLASAGYSIQPVNGEFSAWSQGVNVPPDGWTVQSGTWGSSLSQCQGALGPYAVDFGAASGVGALTSEDIAVMPATKYLLSGYYRVTTASGTANSQGLRVDWYDDSRALIQSDYVDCAATTSGAWTAKGSEITSPNAAVYARVLCGRFNVQGSADFQLDSVKFDRAIYIPTGSISLDSVADGPTTYARPKADGLSLGYAKTDSLVDGLFSKVASGYVDGTTKAITNIYNGTASVSGANLFNKAADNLGAITDGGGFAKVNSAAVSGGNPKTDSLVDGTYSKVAAGYVDATSKAITNIWNGTASVAGSALFNKSLDNLSNVADGGGYGKVNSTALSAGNPKTDALVDGTYAKVLATALSAGNPKTDSLVDGTYAKVLATALSSGNPKTDSLVDGTYAKVLATQLTSGAITSLTRSGTSYATTTFFQKALDNLDNVTDGTTYAKVNATALSAGNPKMDSVVDGTTYGKVKLANLTSGVVSAVDYGGGTTTSTASLFRKGTDTFASVAGTLSDGQLGTNVVNASNIKDLVVTAAELNDGIAISAYDEAGPDGIANRGSVVNCTKTSWDGAAGYIRFTVAAGVTTPQITTGLYTGTSTTLATTTAVMRYRFSGGAIGVISKVTAVNTANTAQKVDTVFLADGNWHTAVWDISAWTTAGTLRIDPIASSMPSTGYLDISYIGTGNPASGTGALVSYQTNVGIGVFNPGSKLTVGGVLESTTGGFKYPDAQTATTIPALVYRVAGTDFSTTSTTLTNITGLVTGALSQNTAYLFEAYIPWQSSATSAGAQFGIASSSATLLNWTLDYVTTQAAASSLQCIHAVSLATPYGPAASGAINTTYIARIVGTLVTAGAGTPTIAIQIRASSAATVKAMIGSYLLVRKATT